MRKLSAIILLLALLVGICGCTPGQTPNGESTGDDGNTQGVVDETGFRVGFSKVNITPEEDVPMGGYGNTMQRISDSILDYLYATCVAITDENDNTVLLFTLDQVKCEKSVIEKARESIRAATGVPVDSIMFSATHTHCTPAMEMTGDARIVRYNASFIDWVTEGAVLALEDRRSAEIYVGTVMTEGLNFVRHYVLKDGIVAGDNHNHDIMTSNNIVSHTTEADGQMQMIKFVRDGGKDILLANWQTHPHRAGGSKKYYLTSDLVGVFRDAVEAELDCHVAYFSGAGGNVNATSRISEENITKDYIESGQKLAEYALSAQDSFTQVQTGSVVSQKVAFEGQVNHTQDGMVAEARIISQMWSSTHDATATVAAAKPYGIYSPFHANAILRRASSGETLSFDIYCISVGDVSFITAPFEMFDTNGVYIKENTPYAMTFILTKANADVGYIPSAYGYEYGCYESDTTNFNPGTGEEVAQLYVQTLTQMYAER